MKSNLTEVELESGQWMCTKLAVKEKEMYVNCRGASRSQNLYSVFCEYDKNEIVFWILVTFKVVKKIRSEAGILTKFWALKSF